MTKSAWIIVGTIFVAIVLACGGILFRVVLPQAKHGIEYSKTMNDYSLRTRELEESNLFTTDIEGGGSLKLTEIGVRRGGNIELWKPGSGWKTLKDEKVDAGFEIKYGYIRGTMKGRDLTNFAVYSELGRSKMKPNGDFVIDINNLRINDTNLSLSDGPFRIAGEWRPGSKSTGSWSVNKQFKLGSVTEVMGDAELWPFNLSMGHKVPDPQLVSGLLIQADINRLDPVDRRVEFTLRSGEKIVADGYTFFDDRQKTWWVFPYDGNLKDIKQADYQVRDAHYIYLYDVDFF